MKKVLVCLFVALLIGGIIWGIACSKSSDSDDDSGAPDIPAAASMRISFSTFPDVSSSARAKPAAAYCEHFIIARNHVAVWYMVTSTLLAIPASAFGFAITQTPEYEGDSTWSWT